MDFPGILKEREVCAMPLSMAPEGKENVICKIGGKEETRLFLERLGSVSYTHLTLPTNREV